MKAQMSLLSNAHEFAGKCFMLCLNGFVIDFTLNRFIGNQQIGGVEEKETLLGVEERRFVIPFYTSNTCLNDCCTL